jgi:hypothetical protein
MSYSLGAQESAARPAVAPTIALGARVYPTRAATGNEAVAKRGEARVITDKMRAAGASFAVTAPILDGRDDDAVWRQADLIDGFRMTFPTEDGAATHRTTARVAYDARNLYVFVRAYDPRPDSIVALLSRRDVVTPSDWVRVMVDSYHDKRTGYQFAVNPAGVQRDIYISNDGEEDESWDAVWDVVTRIDAEGWTAEFRIPLSQLRYPDVADHTFGVLIARNVGRTQELDSWPLYRRSKTGLVSQFGDVTGLRNLGAPRRLEIRPYSVSKNTTRIHDNGDGTNLVNHPFGEQFGADLKYGVTSNLTLDAAVNPDFGQVEADPAVLNLSAFEQFFPERRPFFTEGTGILRYDLNCNDGQCSGLFYSRRIGRAPHLSGDYGNETTPQFTPITAAAKLTGRLASGLSIGVLEAFTPTVLGTQSRTVEPSSNYAVARLQQDFFGGNSGIGVMLTGVQRSLDQWTSSSLRRSAYTGGVDLRHRMFSNNYEFTAALAGSYVAGDAHAIALTQQDAVHFYQRTDAGLPYDSTRTSLSGSVLRLGFGKQGGGLVRFYSGFMRTSPGFEINDIGFMQRADMQNQNNWMGLRWVEPKPWYRSLRLNFNNWQQWNTVGDFLGAGGNVNGGIELPNYWNVFMGLGTDGRGGGVDDRAARGGPAVRQSPGLFTWLGFSGDSRKSLVPQIFTFANRGDDGRSYTLQGGPSMDFRATSRLQGSVGVDITKRINDWQWVGNYGSGSATAYTFGRMNQTVSSATARLDVTATRSLSLQLYAQPFVTSGSFSDWRALSSTPRAPGYTDRFVPYGAGANPDGFNYKQFRSNTVVRWEYRPGSTVFFVWQHGRTQDGVNPGTFSVARDYRDLFRAQPDNTFLVKASYWFSL